MRHNSILTCESEISLRLQLLFTRISVAGHVPERSEESTTAHVGADALVCPAERSSAKATSSCPPSSERLSSSPLFSSPRLWPISRKPSAPLPQPQRAPSSASLPSSEAPEP